ncbi:MAG: hypothetical protein QOH46_2837 [Solirubrobacteraceae bacterium]|nr:hypothetical protein [Solirubrobacteraceae bacterium]
MTVLHRSAVRAPSPEDDLVGLACGIADRREAHAPAMRALSRRVDATKLLDVLERHRLIALVGTRLDALGSLPVALGGAVEARLRENRLHALLHDHVGTQVLAALEHEGIRALAFKGFALTEAVHEDPGSRRYEDIDVLVAAGDLAPAVSALEPLGYRGRPAGGASELPVLHRLVRDVSGRMPPVELHWRVHWYEREFSAGMLDRSRASGPRLRATAADELAALLLIFARDGFRGLRLAVDLAAWWDARGDELPPGGLDELRRRHPELGPVWATALRVAERVTGLPADRALGDLAPGRRGRLAFRLSNWPDHETSAQAGAEVSLVDCLLAPRGQVAGTLRRHLFPSSATLDDFYRLPADAHLRRAAWRVAHPPKLLARYVLGLWRARARWRAPAP